MSHSRRLVYILVVLSAAGLVYWFFKEADPETEVRSTFDELVDWVEEGAGRQSLPLALHARELDRFFTAGARVQVIPGRSPSVGRDEVRAMAMAGLAAVESIRIDRTWQDFSLWPSGREATMEVRVRVRAEWARGQGHPGDGVLAIRWVKEDRNWKIDTAELTARS